MDQPKRNISDISHHFLTNIRGQNPPKRTPPGGQGGGSGGGEIPVHAEVPGSTLGGEPELDEMGDGVDPIGRPVTAVLGAGLNGSYFIRCREYAAHLCRDGGRVGLVQVDGCEFRLHLVEHDPMPAELPPMRGRPIEGRMDPKRIREALHELDYDVDQWLLLLPDPRRAEAAPLLQLVDGWTLLAAADHEGVVAGYRALKGMVTKDTPAIRLALVDAADDAEASRMFTKLDGVCRQFLDAGLDKFDRVAKSDRVGEHGILWLRGLGGATEQPTAAAPVQWNVVKNFLARNRAVLEEDASLPEPVAVAPPVVEPVAEPVEEVPVAPEPAPVAAPPMRLTPVATDSDDAEAVIDLPAGGDVVDAVLGARPDLIACKVPVPGGVGQLALRRDGRLVLIAIADDQLADLQPQATALQWVAQSSALLAQALPQLAIKADADPVLMLLVAHRRADATKLQPLVAASTVEMLPYRKVKWGERTGLLLAA
ncbi:MAG: hypothetical protein AAF743_07865 [Planctomycetota bacterium]